MSLILFSAFIIGTDSFGRWLNPKTPPKYVQNPLPSSLLRAINVELHKVLELAEKERFLKQKLKGRSDRRHPQPPDAKNTDLRALEEPECRTTRTFINPSALSDELFIDCYRRTKRITSINTPSSMNRIPDNPD